MFLLIFSVIDKVFFFLSDSKLVAQGLDAISHTSTSPTEVCCHFTQSVLK